VERGDRPSDAVRLVRPGRPCAGR